MKSFIIVICATKSKNQNYVPNIIFFFLIVISVVKPKLCTKHNFFYNLEFKSSLKFQVRYWKKSRNQNRKRKHLPNMPQKSQETKIENKNTKQKSPK